MRTRRRKIIEFGNDIGLSKDEMVQLLQQLPDDIKFINAGRDLDKDSWILVVESPQFEEIPEGGALPYFKPVFTDKLMPKSYGVSIAFTCNCDADYTGLPHSKTCRVTEAKKAAGIKE